ncbi:hypothetical protein DVA86_26300 [Streptomyces armeniacus]|uniref:Uncharacterized protein n=1 Tax=Streptomyces armeniacus TaxID=83291 RepID=A0A345XVF9_9ACTN|nr:hypothetical protein [Streptomyces armeniacus]AXK35625.1 hypothetical protein DVA86_26300 [Streptomyces armeniacus]
MSESPSNQHVTGPSAPEEAGIDDLEHTPEESREGRENGLPRYRIELESSDEGIRRVHHVHADSLEEAVVKVREADQWPRSGPGSDPGRFRVVEATEENASSEARQQRNARRRYLNTIVEAGLTALGKTAPERSDHESFDVLCDFFTRAVTLPGHSAFPSGEAETDRLLNTDDAATVMVELLTTHLDHHGVQLTRTPPMQTTPPQTPPTRTLPE